MSKFDFLKGSRVLETVDSSVNGKVTAIQSLAWGNYIQAGDNPGTLTQSGGVVFDVWKSSLQKVKSLKTEIGSCLILGLGGGSAARLVRRHWPNSNITGVEIDPMMIDMGMKYLGLSKYKVDIITEDATMFSEKAAKQNIKYDLILVDIYVGDEIPDKFESDEFINLTKSLLSDNGILVFNRLYYDEKRGKAEAFGKKLKTIFSSVNPVRPHANIMFMCKV